MDLDFMVSEEAKKAKLRMVRAEKKRLKTLLLDLAEDKKKAAEGLIDECAFMRATLKQLRDYIDANGVIDEMQQGDYSILRESPAVRTYNTMVQKYSAVCKQLFDMLPNKGNLPPADDDVILQL
jgi:hypothetical protein